MSTLIHRWVESCRRDDNPRAVGRVRSGWLVMGEAQFLRGYCLVLPDPVVPHLNALTRTARSVLLTDVTDVGDALLSICQARRCNYEILGNLEPALHVHIFPRYDEEPETLRTRPVWFYDWDAAPRFDPKGDQSLRRELRGRLLETGVIRS